MGGIGIDDDFIRLGGDSLKAIELQNILNGIVPTAVILRYRTPRAIAPFAVNRTASSKIRRGDGIPLSVPQINIFNDIQTGTDPSVYTMSASVPLSPGTTPEQVAE